MVPQNCYFRKGQAAPSTSLPQHFRDPMALPWQLSVLHKWHQDGPPALLFSKGAEARVAFSISTFLRPNGIALMTSALVSDPSPTILSLCPWRGVEKDIKRPRMTAIKDKTKQTNN